MAEPNKTVGIYLDNNYDFSPNLKICQFGNLLKLNLKSPMKQTIHSGQK